MSSLADPGGVLTLGSPGAVATARQRSMSERLELALSWNAVAAELRAGVQFLESLADE